MSSLKEIKNRIGSVKSTLKITSAMKLVASSKLHRAQTAIESMSPYQQALSDTLSRLSGGQVSFGVKAEDSEVQGRTALIAVASNSSLCGGFNSNVAKKATEIVKAEGDVVLYAVGRKMVDNMRKIGLKSEKDLTSLAARATYDEAASLAEELVTKFTSGEFSKVILVYTHFVSTARQEVRAEQYLPFVSSVSAGDAKAGDEEDYIVEPNAEEVLRGLLPKVLSLKIYAMLLDSAAAEHAARTVAMQTATDNGNEILSDLTIEYNKGRQNKITNEILDIVGGSISN